MTAFSTALPAIPTWGMAADRDGYNVINFTVDNASDQIEWLLFGPVSSAQTITRVRIRVNAITGTAPTFEVSAQGINSSGRADGTVKGATNNAKGTITPSGTGLATVTLSESFTLSPGDLFAIVLKHSSGTINGSNSCAFTVAYGNSPLPRFPYSLTYNADTTTTTRNPNVPMVGVGTSSTWLGFIATAQSSQSFHSGSATTRYGNVFTVPSGIASSLQVVGMRVYGSSSTGALIDFEYYSGNAAGDTTIATSVQLDSDALSATTIGNIDVFFPSPQTVSAGSSFRLAVSKAGLDATNFSAQYMDVGAVDDFDSWMPWQQNCFSSSRTSGNWTDLNTRRFAITPLISDFTAGIGSTIVVSPRKTFYFGRAAAARRIALVIPGPQSVVSQPLPIRIPKSVPVRGPEVTRRQSVMIPGAGSVTTNYVPICARKTVVAKGPASRRQNRLIPGPATTVQALLPLPRNRPIPQRPIVNRVRSVVPVAAIAQASSVLISPVKIVR